jgi:Transposase IS116/IS110/IS902 family
VSAVEAVDAVPASPIQASSGKTQRHRLNRGGDRQANAALYRIVIARLRHDQQTKDYLDRRIHEGKSKKEAIRCFIGRVSVVWPGRSSPSYDHEPRPPSPLPTAA